MPMTPPMARAIAPTTKPAASSATGGDHGDRGEDEPERVELAAARTDHQHEARHREHRAADHDQLRHPPRAHPGEQHERDRCEVLDQERHRHRDALDRGVEGDLHAGDGDEAVQQDRPAGAPERPEVEPQGDQGGNDEQRGRDGDARQHGRSGRPAGLEERLDEHAARPEREARREPQRDADDPP
jgi:hypothetical protein